VRQLLTAVIVIGVALITDRFGRYPASAYERGNNMTQNKSDC